jgi:uncharacterized protein
VDGADLLAALAIAVGIVGILVPVLPGTLLVAGAVVGWAWYVGGTVAWTATSVALGVLAVGAVVKYTVPGRRLKAHGTPNRTLVLGGLLGVVGFFVVPVVGLFLGFVLGIYLAETHRLGRRAAGPATRAALKAVGLSLLIELLAAMVAAVAWAVGAFSV